MQLNDDVLMFDAGPGATHRLVRTPVPIISLTYLFFTHHHFDHNVDYGHLVLARWDQGAGQIRALQAYGPEGTRRLTDQLFSEGGVHWPDIHARCHHPMSLHMWQSRGGSIPRHGPDLGAKDIQPGLVCTAKDWEVRAGPAMHAQPYLDSLAYRLDADDGSVVLTGDTAPCQSIATLARGADVLIHMCTGLDEDIEDSGQRWSSSGPKGAARVAEEAGVRKLVLSHLGIVFDRPGVLERSVEEARNIFGGEVIAAQDLLEIQVR